MLLLHLLTGLLVLLLGLTFFWGQATEGSHVEFTDNSHYNDNSTHEDQEAFQDQEQKHSYSNCNEQNMTELAQSFCWMEIFHSSMIRVGENNWCDWEMVLRYYNYLTICLEEAAILSKCYYPNRVVQDLFVEVHRQYFGSCDPADESLPDAPPALVVFLTLFPVSIIPVLVYAVLCKSAVRD